MRKAAKKELVKVRPPIRPVTQPSESPRVDQAYEGVVLRILEVAGHDVLQEGLGKVHLPSPAVGQPRHDVMQRRFGEDGVELGGELLHAGGRGNVRSGGGGRGQWPPRW